MQPLRQNAQLGIAPCAASLPPPLLPFESCAARPFQFVELRICLNSGETVLRAANDVGSNMVGRSPAAFRSAQTAEWAGAILGVRSGSPWFRCPAAVWRQTAAGPSMLAARRQSPLSISSCSFTLQVLAAVILMQLTGERRPLCIAALASSLPNVPLQATCVPRRRPLLAAASSAYYFHAFRPQYMRLANSRQAAFHRRASDGNGGPCALPACNLLT